MSRAGRVSIPDDGATVDIGLHPAPTFGSRLCREIQRRDAFIDALSPCLANQRLLVLGELVVAAGPCENSIDGGTFSCAHGGAPPRDDVCQQSSPNGLSTGTVKSLIGRIAGRVLGIAGVVRSACNDGSVLGLSSGRFSDRQVKIEDAYLLLDTVSLRGSGRPPRSETPRRLPCRRAARGVVVTGPESDDGAGQLLPKPSKGVSPEEQELIDKYGGVSHFTDAELRAIEKRAEELGKPRSPTLVGLADVARALAVSEKQLRTLAEQGQVQILTDVQNPAFDGVPAWQIHEGSLLPGLPVLLAGLGDESPRQVEGFMRWAEIEDDDVYTVTEWLVKGGDPGHVVWHYQQPPI